ncbi:HNH endonuclease [Deinococcus ficus]|uniref:HNH endonuclease n=1 Tax=Deinococcus ficus TaxID=317577 RepID=UPI0012DE961A|nr:HNH endonuclease [Deinococcus ficus]
MARIPTTTVEAVTSAFQQFDARYGSFDAWFQETQRHHSLSNQRYVVLHNGRQYPPKVIVSLATGLSSREFSGGWGAGQANTYLQNMGFTVTEMQGSRGTSAPPISVEGRKAKVADQASHPSDPVALTSPIRKVLIHRYDNELDIRAIESRGYSDVYSRVKQEDFSLVVVVPTLAANSTVAIVADARSAQFTPTGGEPWPGRPDRYPVRVNVDHVRYTTVNLVRAAVEAAGVAWRAQWTVRLVELDPRQLFAEGTVEHAHLAGDVALPEEVSNQNVYPEGAVRQVLVNAYERSSTARRRCLEHHGTACHICHFDFGVVYGDAAAGIIHVHHLKPLSEIGRGYHVDPVHDLIPVCPNCHAVIHKRNPAYSVDEVRAMLAKP